MTLTIGNVLQVSLTSGQCHIRSGINSYLTVKGTATIEVLTGNDAIGRIGWMAKAVRGKARAAIAGMRCFSLGSFLHCVYFGAHLVSFLYLWRSIFIYNGFARSGFRITKKTFVHRLFKTSRSISSIYALSVESAE